MSLARCWVTYHYVRFGAYANGQLKRARAWIGDPEPLNTPLANPEGTASRPGVGCPVLSAGPDAYLAETLLIHARPAVLGFIREVAAAAAGGKDFRNPRYEIVEAPPEPDSARYWKGEGSGKGQDGVDAEAKGVDGEKDGGGWDEGGAAESGAAETGTAEAEQDVTVTEKDRKTQ